jgi:hypothetical protein
VPVWWLVIGGALVVVGVVMAVRAASSASGERATGMGGLVIALGLSLAFWGLVGVVIGIVVVSR